MIHDWLAILLRFFLSCHGSCIAFGSEVSTPLRKVQASLCGDLLSVVSGVGFVPGKASKGDVKAESAGKKDAAPKKEANKAPAPKKDASPKKEPAPKKEGKDKKGVSACIVRLLACVVLLGLRCSCARYNRCVCAFSVIFLASFLRCLTFCACACMCVCVCVCVCVCFYYFERVRKSEKRPYLFGFEPQECARTLSFAKSYKMH